MSKLWWTPLTGVLFVIVVVVSFTIAGEPPDVEDPVQEIVSHYTDDKDAIFTGAILSGIAAALLIFFAGILRQALRAAEGPDGVLSLVSFAGAVVVAIGATIDSTISIALAEAADDIEPTAVQALQALWDNDFLPFAMGNLVFTLATGLSIVRHGALPKWVGWIGIVLGVVSLTPVGFFAFFGAGIWILIISVILTLYARQAGPTAGAAAGPTAPAVP